MKPTFALTLRAHVRLYKPFAFWDTACVRIDGIDFLLQPISPGDMAELYSQPGYEKLRGMPSYTAMVTEDGPGGPIDRLCVFPTPDRDYEIFVRPRPPHP